MFLGYLKGALQRYVNIFKKKEKEMPVKKSDMAKKPSAKEKIGVVMDEFKEGKLHSGKSDKPVKKHSQAIAIALSEARKAGAKIKKPKK